MRLLGQKIKNLTEIEISIEIVKLKIISPSPILEWKKSLVKFENFFWSVGWKMKNVRDRK